MAPGRLTLSADRDIIATAHAMAKEEGTSVSSMFSRFIEARKNIKKSSVKISPSVKRISGIISLPKDFDYKKELSAAIAERHGVK